MFFSNACNITNIPRLEEIKYVYFTHTFKNSPLILILLKILIRLRDRKFFMKE